jgi:hypothetical protein
VKIGAESKTKVWVMLVLLAIFVLVALYNFKDSIWGTSAAAPAAPAPPPQQKKGSGTLPAHDASDPALRLDILDASRKVKYEAANRNPFAMETIAVKGPDFPVKTVPTPTPIPTPTPWPKIPVKFYGFASKPGEPKKIFLQPEGKEQVYISKLGDIVDNRYRVVQIQSSSVTMEDVMTGNRQSIPVENMPAGAR